MQISLCSEDIPVFQHIYTDKPEAVDWMLKFGYPLERVIAGLIKQAIEGKTGNWSLSPANNWIPVKYI